MMSFEEFVSKLHKPWFVYSMARGVAFPHGPQEEARTPLQRSGRTRMANAQRKIDDLILQRAQAIADERRCAAVAELDNPKGPLKLARCEYPRGHGPVQGRRQDSPGGMTMHDKEWDHAAPSEGIWWMEGADDD